MTNGTWLIESKPTGAKTRQIVFGSNVYADVKAFATKYHGRMVSGTDWYVAIIG